jgi:hypothetical protein
MKQTIIAQLVTQPVIYHLLSTGFVRFIPVDINPCLDQEILLFTDSGAHALCSFKGDRYFMYKPVSEQELVEKFHRYLCAEHLNFKSDTFISFLREFLPKADPTVLEKLNKYAA